MIRSFFFSLCAAMLVFITGISIQAKDADEAYLDYLGKVRVENPVRADNVAIFPLCGTGTKESSLSSLLTLDEAIERKGLTVKELKPESVNNILVQNTSSNWIYVMAGEILTGSKQDRILKDDLLLPPKSGNIQVSAFCVEHGRWTYKSETFSSSKNASNIAVRQKARETADQSRVWGAINDTQKAAMAGSAMPSTQALNETYKAPVVEKKIDDLYNRFENLPKEHASMTGALVVIGDRILCADMFGDRNIFVRLWPKLLKSYMLEAISQSKSSATVSKSDCIKFMGKIRNASFSASDAPGEGMIVTLKSQDVTGSALIYQRQVLHSDVFPTSAPTVKTDVKQVQPIQRQYR